MAAHILVAGLFHETHCFLGTTTPLDAFTVRHGDKMLACIGDGSPLDGVLEAAESFGWRLTCAADYRASPSATVEHHVFEAFWSDVAVALNAAQALDAVYLVLHGAMVTTRLDDVEGEFLKRLRAIDKAKDIPIFGVFDLHATFTEAMARHADCLVGYRENPHIDSRESAMRAAALLDRCLKSGKRPRMSVAAPGIIWPPSGTGTGNRPMAELCRLAREAERQHPDLYVVNIVGGFAYADAAEVGVSVSAAGTDPATIRDVTRSIAEAAWTVREEGLVTGVPVSGALERLPEAGGKPLVLIEASDNVGAGAAGDATGLLRALIDKNADRAALVINDAEAVATLTNVAIGQSKRLAIGGKGNPFDDGPVSLAVKLVHRSDGRFELEDRQSHLASMMGVHIDMGTSCVVRYQGITILLTTRKTPPFDLGQLRSQGIEPTECAILGVKAAVGHKRAYDPIAGLSVEVDTPGPCTNRIETLPFTRLQKPVFPLTRKAAAADTDR